MPAALTLTVLTASPLSSTPAAASTTPLSCTFESTIEITPAIGTTDAWYAWSTSGEPAVITCHGTLNGTVVAGTGRFRETGRGFGSRTAGRGAVDFAGWLPTADGSTVDFTGHLWLERAGLVGTMSGVINGELIGGAYTVQPHDPLAPSATGSTATVRGITEYIGDDSIVPPAPIDVAAHAVPGGVRLSWSPGDSAWGGDTKYHLYLDDVWVAEVAPGVHTHELLGVVPGRHSFAVAAFSVANVESDLVRDSIDDRRR